MRTTVVPQKPGISQEKFERLYREHYQMVYRAAYRVTRRREDAEDALQTVFTKLAQQEFRTDFANAKEYLYRSAIKEAFKILQSRRRPNQTDADVEGLVDPVIDREGYNEEMRLALREAIALLDPSDAELLVLFYDYGYDDAEVATMIGKSPAAVRMTLSRVRAQLKKFICDEGEQNQ